MNKIFDSPAAALDGLLTDGMTIMSGGFGLSGDPRSLITCIHNAGVRNITLISNNFQEDQYGLADLLGGGQIRKIIASQIGASRLCEQLRRSGRLEIEINAKNTLAERVIAGGAGIPAFYSQAGAPEVGDAGGVRRTWLKADLAIVKAWRADSAGNLIFRKAPGDFNPMLAMAAKVTVVEVEEVIAPGAFDPDCIHARGIYVDRIVRSAIGEKNAGQPFVRRHEAA